MTTLKEDMRKKMDEIIWTEEKDNKKEEKKVTKTQTENNVKDVENKVKDVENNVKNSVVENKEVKPKAAKPKKSTENSGNKEWVENLPEDKKFDENTVFCYNPEKECKIGRFKSYARKEGVIWLEMFKKGSFELMSREWAVKIDKCELVEKDGVLINPDIYSKDSKGYHADKDKIKARAEKPEEKVENVVEQTTERIADPSKEIAAEDLDINE